jgi:phage replication initiation protein
VGHVSAPLFLRILRILQPPSSNTGALITNSLLCVMTAITISLGWITCTFPKHHSDALIDFISGLSCHEFQYTDRGFLGYKFTTRWNSGVILAYSEDRKESCLSVPGRFLESISLDCQRTLIQYLSAYCEAKFTRLDFSVDDRTGTLNRTILKSCYENRTVRTRSRDLSWTETNNGAGGFTFAIGSRSSNTYTRIYDKAAESNLSDPCVRVEVECKGEQAQAQVALLLKSLPDWFPGFVGVIRSAIDFVDVQADSNISRCPLLDFWNTFVSSLPKFRYPIPKPVYSIDSVTNWIFRQWSSTMALLSKIYSYDGLKTLLHTAITNFDGNFNLKHRYLIASAVDN